MLLLNFTHPLTSQQHAQLTALLGSAPEVRTIPVQIDQSQPLAPQVVAIADAAGLTPSAWQTTPLIINPPGLALVTALLLAEIHGRSGGFPTVVRIRPVVGSVPTSYEIAEVLNLQTLRETARLRR